MSTPAITLRTPRRYAPALSLTGLAGVVVACSAVALLSLLLSTTPTYDPWAWIIWGREVSHLSLNTEFGPSWKPLPVLVTTVFSVIPAAAPALWVAVARAGALLSVVLAFRVASRLAGTVIAGVVAAVSLALASGYLRFGALGDSEGLLVAFILAAVELHLSGRRRAALWAAFGACLLRPEAWPFAAVYALWLCWAHPRERTLVAGMTLGGLALWFAPEVWGSGDAFRAGARAHTPNPNSLAFAAHPAWSEVKLAVEMVTWPVKAGFVALVTMLAVPSLRSRVPGGRATSAIALGAVAWLALVAAMTQAGFSGNARYLAAPIALACVAAGVGWSAAVSALPVRRPAVAIVATAALLAVFAIAPLGVLRDDARALRNEQVLNDQLADAVESAGGPAAVRACGRAVTGPFQVPALAWRLDRHLREVGSAPAGQPVVPSVPGVVFRAAPVAPGATTRAPVIAVDDPRFTPVATAHSWQVLFACGAEVAA